MHNLLIALLIGIIAGLVDALPMVIRQMDKFASLSAFAHWVVLGLIIPSVHWGMLPWLTGLIIGALSAVPVILMIFPRERKSAVPIFLFSLVLGTAVGWTGGMFIG